MTDSHTGQTPPTRSTRDIIYLCEGFIDHRDLARFGFTDWAQYDLNLQGWELWPILYGTHPQPERQHEQSPDTRIRLVDSLDSLRVLVSEFPDAVYILLFGLTSSAGWSVYSLLKEQNCASAIMQLGAVPSPIWAGPDPTEKRRHIANSVVHKLRLLTHPSELADYANYHYYERRSRSAKPTYLFVGGTEDESRSRRLYDLADTRIVFAHGMDYDLWMQDQAPTLPDDMPTGNYGVFLDTYEPHHPDNVNLGIESVPADEYYAHISRFMQRVEQDLGMPVVVAAHPRSQYTPNDPRFAGRPVIRHATAALVKGASCVFGHNTTSISFAVLSRKPILLITTRAQLDIPLMAAGIRGTELALQTRACIIDELDEAVDLGTSELRGPVRDAVYDSYRDRYLYHPSSVQAPLGRIVADAFFGAGDRVRD